jgi:hypothetical protein
MAKLFDKLNTPTALIVVLVLFLLVDGFLFYRYRFTTETATASAPSLDISLATYKEDDGPSEEEEPAVKESGNEAEQPNGEKKGILGAEEPETGFSPVQAPSYTAVPAQSAEQPALVAVENTAVLPAQEAPVPTYPTPVYEE